MGGGGGGVVMRCASFVFEEICVLHLNTLVMCFSMKMTQQEQFSMIGLIQMQSACAVTFRFVVSCFTRTRESFVNNT